MSVSTNTNGLIKVLPPKTVEELLARERERKARTTLLMALPEDHLAKFHKITNAKEMFKAIKSRFGGNNESKKMHKYILKQQFEGFSVPNSEGLHKGYDRYLPSGWSQVSLIMRTKPGVDSLSFDDLYNNLRVLHDVDLEIDWKWAGHFARECRIKGNQDSRRRDAWNSRNKDGEDLARQEKSTTDVDSDDEHRKCLKIVTFEGTMDSEIIERKSVIARLNKVSSPDGDYLVIYRANGNFRAFNYLLKVLHIFDRQDLFHLYELVMKQYSKVTMEGIECIFGEI
ncbi:hypothetical protein Tco_1227593 [Tanacetum coccineum]